ncbi:MAG: hypothetical protein Alpg2KO_13440 [Alphaproteobacteria bacterium]
MTELCQWGRAILLLPACQSLQITVEMTLYQTEGDYSLGLVLYSQIQFFPWWSGLRLCPVIAA